MGVFSWDLPTPPQPGDKLYIEGRIDQYAQIFSIALVSQYKDGKPWEVPVHYKAYFEDGTAATNTKQNGVWNTETDTSVLPLAKGKHFDISINVYKKSFKFVVKDEGQYFFIDIPHIREDILTCCDLKWTLNIWEGHGKVIRIVYDNEDCPK